MPQVSPETGIISLEKNCPIQHIHSGTDTPRIKTSDLEDDASLLGGGFTSKSRAYLNGNQSVATGAEKLIELETESYDIDGEFDTTSHLFTATTAGYYYVGAAVWIDAQTADKQYSVSIYKNATRACRTIVHSSHVQNLAPSVSSVIYLAASDTVSLYMGHNEAGNINAVAGEGSTYLSIHRLS
jgi:hypothetical protein